MPTPKSKREDGSGIGCTRSEGFPNLINKSRSSESNNEIDPFGALVNEAVEVTKLPLLVNSLAFEGTFALSAISEKVMAS